MSGPTKYVLGEERIPTHWVNLMPDLPGEPLPPLSPATMEPAGPPDLAPIFPMALIEQEVSGEPEIEIPDEVREIYSLWRPTPLFRARRLEKALGTPAHIYYKYEGVSPAGSHKPNSAVPQAYYNREAGIRKLVTETGAGQWGSSAGARLQAVRPRVRGLHGRRQLRPEAVPAGDDRDLGRDDPPQPLGSDRGRALAGLASDRQPRDRDLGGGRGGRIRRRHQLCARLGPQPRLPPPDGDRPGVHRAARARRRVPRRRHRLRRRRLQLRRGRVPVPPPAPPRGRRDAVRGGGAVRLPDPDPGRVPLRLRRHRRNDAADADVHARPRLRPARAPLRRPPLPRRLAARQRPRQGRRRRTDGDRADERLRGGHPVRRDRGDHPGAGGRARDSRRHRRGRGRQARPARSG